MVRQWWSMALPVAVLAGLTACASRPNPDAHKWYTMSAARHIPMQGLPAVPQVILDDRSVLFANFGDESKRAQERDAQISAGAASGALDGGMMGLAGLASVCAVLPPFCVGMFAIGTTVGAAAGGATSAVTVVPAVEAQQLEAVLRQSATSSALRTLVASRMGLPAGQEGGPRLHVRVFVVRLAPTTSGVSFHLAAEARGSPAQGQAWKPSLHVAPYPSRSSADWLAAGGYRLQSDTRIALRLLSESIVTAYLPYENR